MLSIQLSRRVRDFLEAIPKKHAGQIAHKIQEIATDPNARPPHPLRGFPGYYRVKSGEYRFIYRIENDHILLVLIAGKRNDDEIYRDFLKMMK
ncbi:MAG: type II toxin-antitoxin system RelE/ParE family toxin [Candidatus Gracilibacteria bacterium]|nr:type II toxin-antitoxin system RelE/ParE family toxin [Candidatus Gracilibacteria bacterium]